MREGLLAASVAVGLGMLGEFLDAEVTEKAGPKGRHNPERTASRHGTERATVPLGGRRVRIDKPRVRAVDGSGEIRLDTWDAVQAVDLLSEHMVAAALAGVSTRNYQRAALEQVGEVAARSTAKSTVSARFVAATRARLDELRNRDLSGRRWLVVYVDGFEFAGQTMVGALGVDAEGNKMPLGIIQGTTENKTVCGDLLTKVVERGLDDLGRSAGSCWTAPRRYTPPCATCSTVSPSRSRDGDVTRQKTPSATSPPRRRAGCAAASAPPGPNPTPPKPEPLSRSWPASSTISTPTPPPRCVKASRRPSPSTGSASAAPSPERSPRRTRSSPPSTSSDHTPAT